MDELEGIDTGMIGAVAASSNSMFSSLFDGMFNSSGTKECGARPTCLGWSEGCKQKQDQYYECTRVASQSKATVMSGIVKVAIIGACVVAGIIVIAMVAKGGSNRQ